YMRQMDAQAMRVSEPVWLFSLALSFAAGLLFGLAPAIQATGGNLNAVLKGGSAREQLGPRSSRFRGVLLAGQMALVAVLLVSAGMMIQAFARLTAIPLGFEKRNILAVRLTPSNGPAARQFFDRLESQVRALPGVQAATISEDLPGLVRANVTSPDR